MSEHACIYLQCPLYGKAKPVGESATPLPAPLPDLDTLEDGLIFKQCVKDRVVDDMADNQQIILSDDEETRIGELLSGLSKKERKRVLKKLAKSGAGRVEEGKGDSEKKLKRKHGKKKKKVKKEHGSRRKKGHSESLSSGSESESEDDDRERKRKRKKHHKVKKQHSKKASQRERSSDVSKSESDSENDRERKRKMKPSRPSEGDHELSGSEVNGERRQKRQRREDIERHYDRRSSDHQRERPRDGGSKAKSQSSHYERGRTHYDRDRESRRQSNKHHSGSEDDHYSQSRSKNSQHRRT